MRPFRLLILSLFAAAAALGAVAACGEDSALVRGSVGPASDPDAGEGGACTVAIPDGYMSPTFETNAADAIALRNAFRDFTKPLIDVETALADAGARPNVTQVQLVQLWTAGPNVRGATTPYLQGRIAGWLGEYEDAGVATWAPASPPPTNGGSYGTFVFGATGLDLRQAIERGTIGAAFYHRAGNIIQGGLANPSSITEGTLDQLVALYGASPAFANNPNPSVNGADVLAAADAARRSPKDQTNSLYQAIKKALVTARASLGGSGQACIEQRNFALKQFLELWERSAFATVIFHINDAKTRLGTGTDSPNALHAYSQGVGLMLGFKAVPSPHRKISDTSIDELLTKALYAEGTAGESFKLVTQSADGLLSLSDVIQKVQTIYGFSDLEVQAFKTSF